MKDGSSKNKGETVRAHQSPFVVEARPDCWIAHSSTDPLSGFLLYNKLTGTYHAWVCEQITTFPKLAQAPYKNVDDSPVDKNHNLKADFVMLLALRKRFKEHVPGSQFIAWSWRKLAFQQGRSEIEAKTGKPLSEKNWAHCMKIANSEELFEDYAAKWLANIVCDDGASEILGRFGKWLEKAEDIENEEIPAQYSKFFTAVESAAMDARGVPEKKAVQAIYEKGMSANQLGKGHAFRDVMRQLKFQWLPAGKRGRAQHPEKSGIR